ncbi:MAG: hypothetical protein IJU50_09900 [Lachnospiraceae bacterium]|nr:hypothetical protein [Lachnospiraceae bacterium]
MAIPVFLLVAFFVFDYLSYAASPEWSSFRRFNTLREDILDYNSLQFDAHSEEYERAGITRQELKLLEAWIYADTEVFTPDKLQKIRDILYADGSHSLRLGRQMVSGLARNVRDTLWEHSLAVFSILSSVFTLFFLWKQKSAHQFNFIFMFSWLSMLLLFCLELWYLHCMGRPLWRVAIGGYLSLSCFLAFLLETSSSVISGKISDVSQKDFVISPEGLHIHTGKSRIISNFAAIALLFLLVVIGIPTVKRELKKEQPSALNTTEAFFNHIQKEGSLVYVGAPWPFLVDRQTTGDIFQIDGRYRGHFEHFVFLGGWMIPSPTGLGYAKASGIENPLRAVMEGKAVLAGEEEDAALLEEYFQSEYGFRDGYSRAGEAGGITLWHFP